MNENLTRVRRILSVESRCNEFRGLGELDGQVLAEARTLKEGQKLREIANGISHLVLLWVRKEPKAAPGSLIAWNSAARSRSQQTVS